MSDTLLNVKEMARLLRTTVKCIHAMRHRGQLPPTVGINTRLLWHRETVDAWLRSKQQKPLPHLYMPKNFPERPSVRSVAERMGACVSDVMLQVFRLWSWADTHAQAGILVGIELAQLPTLCGGITLELVQALADQGLIRSQNEGLVFTPLTDF